MSDFANACGVEPYHLWTLLIMLAAGFALGFWWGDCEADSDRHGWLGSRSLHRCIGTILGMWVMTLIWLAALGLAR